jgi:hypothetical protein
VSAVVAAVASDMNDPVSKGVAAAAFSRGRRFSMGKNLLVIEEVVLF